MRVQDPRINRDRILAELKSKGKDTSSPRIVEALRVIGEVRKQMERDGDVRLSEADCYAGGCVADVRFRDAKSFLQKHEALGQSVKDRWTGRVFLSGPESRPDSSIASSLVLFSDGRIQGR